MKAATSTEPVAKIPKPGRRQKFGLFVFYHEVAPGEKVRTAMYAKFTGKQLDGDITRALAGKRTTTTAAPEVLMRHLARLLGVRYEPHQPTDHRFKRVRRETRVGDSVHWCERLFRLRDTRPYPAHTQ